jgi:hypothetical protein
MASRSEIQQVAGELVANLRAESAPLRSAEIYFHDNPLRPISVKVDEAGDTHIRLNAGMADTFDADELRPLLAREIALTPMAAESRPLAVMTGVMSGLFSTLAVISATRADLSLATGLSLDQPGMWAIGAGLSNLVTWAGRDIIMGSLRTSSLIVAEQARDEVVNNPQLVARSTLHELAITRGQLRGDLTSAGGVRALGQRLGHVARAGDTHPAILHGWPFRPSVAQSIANAYKRNESPEQQGVIESDQAATIAETLSLPKSDARSSTYKGSRRRMAAGLGVMAAGLVGTVYGALSAVQEAAEQDRETKITHRLEATPDRFPDGKATLDIGR